MTPSVDSDFASGEDRRSTSGILGTISGCITDWNSQTQHTVSLSLAEAEYLSATRGVQMIIFKNNLMNEVTNKIITPSMLLEDYERCIFIIKHQHTSSRTKHIDVRAHLIREHYNIKIFDVIRVDT